MMKRQRLRRVAPTMTLILASLRTVGTPSGDVHSAPIQLSTARLHTAMGSPPLSFEVNRGQTDGRVRFLARASGVTLFLTPTDAILAIASPMGHAPPPARPQSRIGQPNQAMQERS